MAGHDLDKASAGGTEDVEAEVKSALADEQLDGVQGGGETFPTFIVMQDE